MFEIGNNFKTYLEFQLHFCEKFADQSVPPVFEKEKWSSLSRLIVAEIVNRCKASGQPLVQPKSGASAEDWKALATLACWKGQVEMVEFWHLCVSMCHLAGRGATL